MIVNVVDTQLGGSAFTKSKVIIRIAEPPRIGSVEHTFDNSGNTDTNLEFTEAIIVSTERLRILLIDRLAHH